MMIFQMILLGLANADGFFTQTQNAANHYRNAYYRRNSGTYASLRTTGDSFTAMMENIRAQEKRNSRIVYNHQNQRMAKTSDDDRNRRDAQTKQMYDRMAFLRRSCRCRFICTGSREACEELMYLEDQLQK